MPSVLSNIKLLYQVYCPQLNVFWSDVVSRDRDDSGHIRMTCVGDEISLNNIQLLHSLDNKLNELTFLCTIDLVQVKLSGRNHGGWTSSTGYRLNPAYLFDVHKYIDRPVNQPINSMNAANDSKPSNAKQSFRIKWQINEGILKELKQATLYKNNSIISDIYYNMWSLKLNHRNSTPNPFALGKEAGSGDKSAWNFGGTRPTSLRSSSPKRGRGRSHRKKRSISPPRGAFRDNMTDTAGGLSFDASDNDNSGWGWGRAPPREPKKDELKQADAWPSDMFIKEQDSIVTISLKLNVMPPNISAVVAFIKLSCLQSQSEWITVQRFRRSGDEENFKGQDTDIIIKNKYIDIKNLAIIANITVIEAYDQDGNELSLKLQKPKQELSNNASKTRDTTINYSFEPSITGDLNLRLHHQHILMSKDAGIYFPELSQAELRDKDYEKQMKQQQQQSLQARITKIKERNQNKFSRFSASQSQQIASPSFTTDINAEIQVSDGPWTNSGHIQQQRANILHGDRVLIKDVNDVIGFDQWVQSNILDQYLARMK